MKKCNHGATSNTGECFRTFIGCTVKGMVRAQGNYTLVFNCGWGLTFRLENGSHWTESPEQVQKMLYNAKRDLAEAKKEIEHVLKLAGEEV